MSNHYDLYRAAYRIRRIEETIGERYSQKQMRCPVHLSIGQEWVPVVVASHLKVTDHVYSNHRCHAHYLAKGGDLNAMIAELMGKSSGCCGGKGGSMHLVDPEQGMMGSSALVGGTIPMAVGSGLTFKMGGGDQVAVPFFGDGATEEGIFYESLNFAQLKKLPVLFICENNFYATYSAQSARQAHLDIAARVRGMGMMADRVDGYDIALTMQAVEEAVDQIRKGKGPVFLEFLTYRFRDHVGPEVDIALGYRTEAEWMQWKDRDPIPYLEKFLVDSKMVELSAIEKMKEEIEEEIEAAFDFAARSVPAPIESIFEEVYAPTP